MEILEYMETHGHEQLLICHEPSQGLRAFIAIHDTTLGPAVEVFAYGRMRARPTRSWTCFACPAR